jgi:hypothetical protein
MKDPYEVLREKEADLARVRHEIESLHAVASLLSDDVTSDEPNKKKESAAETLDRGSGSEATGTDGLFSSIPASRPGWWQALKRGK